MRARSVAATHVGRVRDHNEDAFLALDDRQLWAVADGLGGHAAGEVASKLAVTRLRDYPSPTAMIRAHSFEPGTVLKEMFSGIHREIVAVGNGMGTTLTAAVLHGDVLHVVHVGDSSAWLLRADWCKRITEEQTISAAYEKATGKKADLSWQGVLGNCLGVGRDAFHGAEHVPVHVVPGDVVVLSTDGLEISEVELVEVASRTKFEDLPRTLVDIALKAGGQDNVTVVAVEFR